MSDLNAEIDRTIKRLNSSDPWATAGAVALLKRMKAAAHEREPVAYLSRTSQGDVLDWSPQEDATEVIPLVPAVLSRGDTDE